MKTISLGSIATQNANAVVITGGTITGLGTPTNASDVVIKSYADAIGAGLNFKDTVSCASTAALTVTYANGVLGVGATLTNAGAQTAFSVDGQSPGVGGRVLIKDQASAFQNGIYTVTVVGDGSTNWVLTRATDYDTAAEVNAGDIIPVQNGTANGGSGWLQTVDVTVMGTTSISFTEYVYPPATFAKIATANSFTAAQNFARATVASHATTGDIWGAAGNQIDWTGTETTTAFPNAPQAGAERVLVCAGACAFTAGVNMLIDGVSSGATVTCAANDQMVVRAISTTQFKLSRIKYDGTSQVSSGVGLGIILLAPQISF